MSMDQLEFDFDDSSATTEGYDNWRAEMEERRKAISREWGVPVESSVRLTLRNMPGEYTGYLALLEYPSKISRKRWGPLRLRLNLDGENFVLGERRPHIDFTSDDIVEWHRS